MSRLRRKRYLIKILILIQLVWYQVYDIWRVKNQPGHSIRIIVNSKKKKASKHISVATYDNNNIFRILFNKIDLFKKKILLQKRII